MAYNDEKRIKHVGMIMDGNRRWAKKHKFSSVIMGHDRGGKKLIEVCDWCIEFGIPYLSVYAFSTENWSREQEEIKGIFGLLEDFFVNEMDTCLKKGIKLRILGNRSMMERKTVEIIEKAEIITSNCKMLNLNIALSYGGKDEIIRAVNKILENQTEQNIQAPISEEVFETYLDSGKCPEMDLVIRTGGTHRLSNFFPWRTAYAEMYFLDTLSPDFTKDMFVDILEAYKNVQINKGK